jgi:hypothetical protein
MPDRPRADKVIARGPWDVLVSGDEPAAMDEHDDRGKAGSRIATRVDVEAVPGVLAVAQVADDPRRGVTGLLVIRREQRP